MKRKSIVLLLLVFCLTLGLCACADPASEPTKATSDGYTEEEKGEKEEAEQAFNGDLSGTGWQCTYHSGDDKIYTRFLLASDGTYNQIIAINELYDHSEKGTYEVKNGRLSLYLNGEASSATVYEIKGEKLILNGNEYTPYSE